MRFHEPFRNQTPRTFRPSVSLNSLVTTQNQGETKYHFQRYGKFRSNLRRTFSPRFEMAAALANVVGQQDLLRLGCKRQSVSKALEV